MEELCQPTYAATPAERRRFGYHVARACLHMKRLWWQLSYYAVKESSTEVPVILVVEEGDHVGEEDIVGFLSAEEHTEARDAVLHQRLFDDVLRVAQ